MLARLITTRIIWRAVGVALLLAFGLAGWQALDAAGQRSKLATAQAELVTVKGELATAKATITTQRATLEAERLAAGADLAQCMADAQAEAAAQYRAGEAAARLSRNCVHDRGPAAVNRSLRDVLGEPK